MAGHDKTEKATPKKREEARKKGQVAKSADLNGAVVLLAVVLTDVAFGLVSRVVPQLNVFAVGFPAKVAVGLVVVGASLPFVAGWLGDELQRSVAAALQALRVA